MSERRLEKIDYFLIISVVVVVSGVFVDFTSEVVFSGS